MSFMLGQDSAVMLIFTLSLLLNLLILVQRRDMTRWCAVFKTYTVFG